jgi:hypothetical protein
LVKIKEKDRGSKYDIEEEFYGVDRRGKVEFKRNEGGGKNKDSMERGRGGKG